MPCRVWAVRLFGPMPGRMGMGPGVCPGPTFFPWPGHYLYWAEQRLKEYANGLKSELARVEEAIREMEKGQP